MLRGISYADALFKGLDPNKTTAEEIMSSPLITMDPDVPLAEALKLMVEKKIRRVFVVEKGKIIGRVTHSGTHAEMLNLIMALQHL